MKYSITGKPVSGPSIVKIRYGQVYVIAKLQTQVKGLKDIEDALNKFLSRGKNDLNGIFYHFYNYIRDHPGHKFKVITLLQSESGYDLLKWEQKELDSGRKDRDFLNNQLQAYIPAYDKHTDMYGWLTKDAVDRFRRYLRSQMRLQMGGARWRRVAYRVNKKNKAA